MNESMLSCNRFQAVRVANSTSSFCSVLSDVPRGSVLGPILFLIYINEVVDICGRDLTVKFYADDVKMLLLFSCRPLELSAR